MERVRMLAVGFIVLAWASSSTAWAQDWPQWRGAHRDGRVAGFDAPDTWPDSLTKKWSVTVGDGVATPALAGDKLYAFSRQEGNEVLRCLDAATGEQIWQDQYPVEEIRGPASSFDGPRSSPAVSEGKVVTLGAQGVLSCYDAESGKLQWRRDDYEGSVPRFYTSSSPIIIDGLCIAQLGSEDDGAVVVYELASGDQKWRRAGEGTAYGSPVLLTLDGVSALVMPTGDSMVALSAENGDILWTIPYQQGRYNAATPIVEDQMLIYAGPTRGMTALKMEAKGDRLAATEVWTSAEDSLQFNTPVLKDGLLFGISNLNSLFCLDARTGETHWSAPLGTDTAQTRRPEGGDRPSEAREGGRRPDSREGEGSGQQPRAGERPNQGPSGSGRFDQDRPGQGRPAFGGRRGRGGPGGGGYGSVVDAGSVLFALTPAGTLIVFKPSAEEFEQLASYKVAEGGTYAYPVISGDRIYIKDRDALTLWSVK